MMGWRMGMNKHLRVKREFWGVNNVGFIKMIDESPWLIFIAKPGSTSHMRLKFVVDGGYYGTILRIIKLEAIGCWTAT